MFQELANVIRTARVRHVLRSFTAPGRAVEAFKYHYRRVEEKEFVAFFADKLGRKPEDVRSIYRDLQARREIWEEMRRSLLSTPRSYGPQMISDGPALYILIRLLAPDRVVETGVAAGVSSCFILQAMQDNGKGRLCSIEAVPRIEPYGKNVGWLVPDSLRHRWELIIGDSRRELPPLLHRLGKIDCFIHDSLHTYDHMFWELAAAWAHLFPGSVLLAHDVGENRAFFDFMSEKGVRWRDYRVHGLLGGFVISGMSGTGAGSVRG